ncbi:hypothetical protein HDU67_005451 [Dinochytrium kinnereticum]|nr:hypothetical protein HDU67_005451 [Dinochytrium kinnereticum]
MNFFHHAPKATHSTKRQKATMAAAERAHQIAEESLSQPAENIIYLPGTTLRFTGSKKQEEQRIHRWDMLGQPEAHKEEKEAAPYDPYKKAWEMANEILSSEYSREGHTKVYGVKSGSYRSKDPAFDKQAMAIWTSRRHLTALKRKLPSLLLIGFFFFTISLIRPYVTSKFHARIISIPKASNSSSPTQPQSKPPEHISKQTKQTLNTVIEKTASPIPKTIWTFYNTVASTSIPPFIKSNIRSWQRLNPTHSITLLTPQTLSDHITAIPPSTLPRSLLPGWVKLAVMTEQGGYWLDPFTILTQPLSDPSVESLAYTLQDYEDDPTIPSLESWFLIAAPRNQWMTAWFQEYTFSTTHKSDIDYMLHLRDLHGTQTFHRIRSNPNRPIDCPRLFLSGQKVVIVDKQSPVKVLPADKGYDAPLGLLSNVLFDERMAARALIEEFDEFDLPPVVRFRERDGLALVELVRVGAYVSEESLYARFVKVDQ